MTYKEEKQLVRARFVAREFKRFGKRYDVFAVASEQGTARLIDFAAFQLHLRTFTFDFSTAFFNAPGDRGVLRRAPGRMGERTEREVCDRRLGRFSVAVEKTAVRQEARSSSIRGTVGGLVAEFRF